MDDKLLRDLQAQALRNNNQYNAQNKDFWYNRQGSSMEQSMYNSINELAQRVGYLESENVKLKKVITLLSLENGKMDALVKIYDLCKQL